MKSILVESDKMEILKRVDLLNENSTGLWGSMNVAEMLAHLNDALKASMGMKPIKSTFPLWLTPLIKLLFLDFLPWTKGLPTAPELDTKKKGTKARDFYTEREFFKTMLDIFEERDGEKLVPHPMFGKISKSDYGKLFYKHTNHHLKQFGV